MTDQDIKKLKHFHLMYLLNIRSKGQSVCADDIMTYSVHSARVRAGGGAKVIPPAIRESAKIQSSEISCNFSYLVFPLNSITFWYSSKLYFPLLIFHHVFVAFVPLKNPNVPSFKLIIGGMAEDSANKCSGIENRMKSTFLYLKEG